MKITSSLLLFLLFIVIIAIPPFVLQYTGNTGLLVNKFWIIFLFMSGLTFLVLVITLLAGKKKQEHMAQGFLGGTTFKILACLIFILVFLSKNAPDKLVFMADFLYIYLLNTAFEVYILLRNLRHENLR
jgi:hypothetical protein